MACKIDINNCSFKKCGEIATFLPAGKKDFFLNCGFCELIFLELNNFIDHIFADHSLEFLDSELKQGVENIPLDLQESFSSETIPHSRVEDTDIDGKILKGLEDVEILEIHKSDIEIEDNPHNLIKEEIIPNSDDEEAEFLPEFEQRTEHTHIKEINSQKKQETNYEIPDDHCMIKAAESDSKVCPHDEKKQNSDDEEAEFLPEFDQRTEHTHIKEINSQKKQETNYEIPGDHCMKKAAESDSKVCSHDEKKRESKSNDSKCPRSSSMLDDAQCICLAGIYKLHTCLWNEEDIAYRFKNRRQEALRAVLKEFNTKTGLNLSQKDLEKEVTLLRKICSNEKKLKIACKKKNTIHKTTCPFYDHISFLEVDVLPFECSKCGKLLPGLGHLKVHFAEHDGSLPFKCNICGHGFQLGNNFTVHLRRHAQDYLYHCEVCNKPYATTTEIKIHMRSHTGERPFVCSVCGETFRTASHLSLHIRVRHEKPRHKCKLCAKEFHESRRLREHMAVHTDVRDQICGVCEKGFKNAEQLRQHQRIHNTEKRYACKFCGKRFAQRAARNGHMKTH